MQEKSPEIPEQSSGQRKNNCVFIIAHDMEESQMSDYELQKNNVVTIFGRIESEPVFSYEMFGERFFNTKVSVKRMSGAIDIIPVVISEYLFDSSLDYIGKYIEIHGQFRSRNEPGENHMRLILYVFAREITFGFADHVDESERANQVFLDGHICRQPTYRKTPLGREIADLLLAVNRPYGKSDYIPCICWGRNARYASAFEVGGHVLIWGRIQSREYMKRIGENETEKRIAYEVSVSKLEYIE